MQTAASDIAIRKIARIQGKPGRADGLREALRAFEAATRQEPGCVEFGFFQAQPVESVHAVDVPSLGQAG